MHTLKNTTAWLVGMPLEFFEIVFQVIPTHLKQSPSYQRSPIIGVVSAAKN